MSAAGLVPTVRHHRTSFAIGNAVPGGGVVAAHTGQKKRPGAVSSVGPEL
jgi:hypothetical protein